MMNGAFGRPLVLWLEQESALMPKPKYDHPVIQKGAVQVFAHLAQKPMSPEMKEVNSEHSVKEYSAGVVILSQDA